MTAGREPVARMMRSKLSVSSPPLGLRNSQRVRISNAAAPLDVFDLPLLGEHARGRRSAS